MRKSILPRRMAAERVEIALLRCVAFSLLAAVLLAAPARSFQASALSRLAKANPTLHTYDPSSFFATTDTVPPPPVLISPANGAVEVPLPVTIRWHSVPGATSYIFVVSTLFSNPITDTEYVLTGIFPNFTFNWTVKAGNSAGYSSFAPAFYFTTVTTPDQVAGLQSVEKLEGLTLYEQLAWKGAARATGYDLQISTDAGFTPTTLLFDSSLTSMNYEYRVPLSGQTYYWRVAGTNQYGSGAYGSSSFVISGVRPAAPQLLVPTNGAKNVSAENATLSWAASDSVLVYLVQVASDSLFTDIGVSETFSVTSFMPGGLPSLKKLYWRVAGFGEGGLGPWSTVYHFTTDLSGYGLPTFPFIAQNYPNPFNPTTTLTYGVEDPAYVRLAIYNTLGQKVRTLVDRNMEPGFYQLSFDGSALPSGMYYEVLNVGPFTATRKLLLVK